jgi:hypothetical protein
MDALARQPEGVLREAEQAARAGAKSADHNVAVVGVKEDHFRHLGMSQVKAAHNRFADPARRASGRVGG